MTVTGFIFGAIIGFVVAASLIVSSSDNTVMGIAIGIALTFSFGIVFSKYKIKS
ncbi:hypothetical protein [Ochrobactrum sp. SFR4]|uniref:hypothetical protein n=1 Tax=Brucellaceae TaxID=118882 RepID=UPI001C8B1032|nr:hypothetical protein [Ochrobactrum sp. SFR4]MBX8783699.1 hypothetical protein [Ochrobactrum sp. GRS2]MBX8824742.1 hypothetical protein [Ochrobactrum sp. SFR4]